MSHDIEEIRRRQELNLEFLRLHGHLPWDQDDCLLALQDTAALLARIAELEATNG